jgi:hypothetical protein
VHEGGVDAAAGSQDARVVARIAGSMQDVCRFLFRNCHFRVVSYCRQASGFIASAR